MVVGAAVVVVGAGVVVVDVVVVVGAGVVVVGTVVVVGSVVSGSVVSSLFKQNAGDKHIAHTKRVNKVNFIFKQIKIICSSD